MNAIVCKQCGAWDLHEMNGVAICPYCGTKYVLSVEEKSAISSASTGVVSSQIALSDDVERLLQKCKTDRKNAKKYANLVLELDPYNEEVLQYL